MRVERSTVDQVQEKLDELKRKKELEESGFKGPSAIESYEHRISQVLPVRPRASPKPRR